MRAGSRAGWSEARLVIGIGGATLAVLVGLMAVASRRGGADEQGSLEAVKQALEKAQAELAAVRQESEDRREALDRLQALVAAQPEPAGADDEAWQALTEENAALRRQVQEGTARPGGSAPEGGGAPAELPGVSAAQTEGLAPKVLQDVRVVDVNPDIGYAVIDVGEEHGVRPGMQFAVTRDGRNVARVTAEDVRAGLTGVSVSLADGGQFPLPGDRAVFATNQ